MKSALFRRWRKNARVEETRLEAGEITVHVVPASNQLTVAVAGRVTVDSSPHLRSVAPWTAPARYSSSPGYRRCPPCPIWTCPASQRFWKHSRLLVNVR